MLAGEGLVGDDAERVKIRSMINLRISNSLLGRHIPDGPNRDPHGRSQGLDGPGISWRPAHRGGGERFGDTEISDHRVARREEYVLRFQIAMNDSLFVRVRESIGELADQTKRISNTERSIA